MTPLWICSLTQEWSLVSWRELAAAHQVDAAVAHVGRGWRTSPSTSTAATVVAMPSYSAFSRVASRTLRLAKRMAVFRRLPS